MATRKYMASTRYVPRRARSRRLREAGLTADEMRKSIRSSYGGVISDLWTQSARNRLFWDSLEEERKAQNAELSQRIDSIEISIDDRDQSIRNEIQSANDMTLQQLQYRTMTDAEVTGMCEAILK